MGRFFTHEEDDFLRRNYKKITHKDSFFSRSS